MKQRNSKAPAGQSDRVLIDGPSVTRTVWMRADVVTANPDRLAGVIVGVIVELDAYEFGGALVSVKKTDADGLPEKAGELSLDIAHLEPFAIAVAAAVKAARDRGFIPAVQEGGS